MKNVSLKETKQAGVFKVSLKEQHPGDAQTLLVQARLSPSLCSKPPPLLLLQEDERAETRCKT
jgi:hypothetical protein